MSGTQSIITDSDTAMVDLDMLDEGTLGAVTPQSDSGTDVGNEKDNDKDNLSDNGNGNGNDDTDSDSDDDDELFREDQVPREQFNSVFALAVKLSDTDTAAEDLLGDILRMSQRRGYHNITVGPLHPDKEGELRFRWRLEEHTAYQGFVTTHAAEIQRMGDAEKLAERLGRANFNRAWENRCKKLRKPFWDGVWREDLYSLCAASNHMRYAKSQQHTQATKHLVMGKPYFESML